jgi:hypothetical protein
MGVIVLDTRDEFKESGQERRSRTVKLAKAIASGQWKKAGCLVPDCLYPALRVQCEKNKWPLLFARGEGEYQAAALLRFMHEHVPGCRVSCLSTSDDVDLRAILLGMGPDLGGRCFYPRNHVSTKDLTDPQGMQLRRDIHVLGVETHDTDWNQCIKFSRPKAKRKQPTSSSFKDQPTETVAGGEDEDDQVSDEEDEAGADDLPSTQVEY